MKLIDIWKKRVLKSPTFFPDGWMIATDGKQYVGMSCINLIPADAKKVQTELTGVLPEYRRKGIATALKVLTIKVAKSYGARIIKTDNEENNPMYTLNLKLGFKPKPAWLHFEKKLE